jgi:hypothetical protein
VKKEDRTARMMVPKMLFEDRTIISVVGIAIVTASSKSDNNNKDGGPRGKTSSTRKSCIFTKSLASKIKPNSIDRIKPGLNVPMLPEIIELILDSEEENHQDT